MDLKKRLASLDRLTRKPQLREDAPDRPERVDHGGIAVGVLGLEAVTTAAGVCYLRQRTDPLPARVGSLPALDGFLTQPGDETLTAEQILFLDTETTGLAGGTGTIPFLVGLSWWAGGLYHTRQYFLCGPGGEAAMLADIHLLSSGFRAVATYNGASFDLPLLKTRALLNRLPQPWDGLLGWDLLVPARRLWGRRLDDCRQQTVEQGVCALRREDRDISGHLIPQTWFDFLQAGQAAGLQRVLYHNRADMLGLGHVFREIVSLASRLESCAQEESQPWDQAWVLGRVAERRGDSRLAAAWMNRARLAAARQDLEAFADLRFLADLLRILKRDGDWAVVEDVLARALDRGRNDWWLHREAAILYEHRLVDLDRARRHALAAGDEHRLLRLKRKLKTLREETT